MPDTPDIVVADHGTVWRFQVRSEAAREWVEGNVEIPGWAGSSRAFTADHRPARDLVEGMLEAGFTVESQ